MDKQDIPDTDFQTQMQFQELIQQTTNNAWTPLLLLVLACLLLIIVLAKLVRVKKNKKVADLYQGRLHLFTVAERIFYQALEKAVGDRYRIHGKLSLGDVVEPKEGMSRSKTERALQQVVNLHVDFVLVRPDSMNIVCVIALEDSIPARRARAKVDTFTDDILSYADIPMVRFRIQPMYTVDEIEAGLAEVLRDSAVTNEPILTR